jgi:serine/threonine-protein kinase
MGTVYRALDPVLERIVAVKLLHPDRSPVPALDGSARFLNEARAVARLNHPNIVSVYDFSNADPAGAFFAMEYVEGCTLEESLRHGQELDLAHALHVMRQLLDGLGYAHARGVIHRDIKPSNLLSTDDGRIKITDFGIAKTGSLKHTMTGLMIGTPAYMAPERYTGGGIDHRCDVYSAGVLMFELLTGRKPFSGTLSEIVYQICHVVPCAVSTLRPALPALLDPLVERALAKKADERFQTAEEFSTAIQQATISLGLNMAPRTLSPARVAEDSRAAVTVQDTDCPSEVALAPTPAVDWTPEELAGIEQQLTPILGPMARIIVKRAAAQTRDRERLCQALAGQLRTDEERKRFLHGASMPLYRKDGAVADASVLGGRLSGASGAISGATLDRSAKILMRYLGPIAVVLVRKAAATAQNEVDLYARLAERISDSSERARFIAELSQPG